jgi:hypothetical protein
MAPYESMAWPLVTFDMFAYPEKTARAVGLSSSSGDESTERLRPRLSVFAGEKDMLMKPVVMMKLVGVLREAVRLMFGSVASDGDPGEGIGDGVEFRVAKGIGHHLMDATFIGRNMQQGS